MTTQKVVSLTLLCVVIVGCKNARLEPKLRPSGVPADAVWAGGGDRGAYVFCSLESDHRANRCTVWNDFTGTSSGSHDYRLQGLNRAATVDELRLQGAANDKIYLDHGLVLQAQPDMQR